MTVDRESGVLHGANLGDSGFFLVRDNKILFQSKEQQYYFNAPYQLSILPPGYGSSLSTRPEDADKVELALEHGDVLIVATDGFLDNVFPQDIPILLQQCNTDNVEEIASTLVHFAQKLSEDSAYASPFAVRSRQHYRVDYFTGGKPDDITVVVAVFLKADSMPEEQSTNNNEHIKAKL